MTTDFGLTPTVGSARLVGPATAPGSPGALRLPGATVFASASASLHYGDNGGFAAAYFSDGTPGFAVPDGGGGNPNLFTTASVSNAHIFDVRLQCFANPNCHSDWSYVWTTNFSAALRDEVGSGGRRQRSTACGRRSQRHSRLADDDD